jgi:hypothetical protein
VRVRELFSVTAWVWRQLASRWACRIYLSMLAVIVIPAVALRLQAVFFQRHVVEIASRRSTLQIGTTSKSETLSRIPGLTGVSSKDGESKCPADECFSVDIPNSKFSNWTLLRTAETDHPKLFSLLHFWGLRYWSFNAYVTFSAGKVSDFGYRLMLSAPRAYPVPGVVMIAVSSERKLGARGLDWELDESPNYEVYHYFKWPDLQTGVYFTVSAPGELLSDAFRVHLRCVWSLRGCETANQLLPEVEQNRLRIRQAAMERMKGPNQCPSQILPPRACDSDDILLVEVKNVGPTLVETNFGAYRFAKFRLLRVLKGKLGRPLDNVGVAPEIYLGEVTVRNSAIDLLNPGQRILLFSGRSTDIDEPCEAMAGTDDAVHTVEEGIAASKP